jgi:hypothetical protein
MYYLCIHAEGANSGGSGICVSINNYENVSERAPAVCWVQPMYLIVTRP